jgi:predicted nucleotidyltransferase
VKITYFDKEAVSEALSEFLKELEKRSPEIKRIILFGSFARGECVPGSDIDLLIVLRESNIPFLERIPKYMPSHFPVGVDVFPYTEGELREMLNSGNFFVKRALEEGIEVLHDKRHATNIIAKARKRK